MRLGWYHKKSRLHGWRQRFWGRRYRPMIVSDEPGAQIERLKYLSSHGVKEHLVEKATQWPGVNAVRSIPESEPLVGYWFNREQEWKARRRGQIVDTYDYATRYEIELARPPCLDHLTPEEYREVIRALVREVEEEAASKRGDRSVVGAAAILAQDPLEPLPTLPKKSPAPRLFFAFSSEVGAAMKRDNDEIVQRHRFASSLLRLTAIDGGDPRLAKGFPPGTLQQMRETLPWEHDHKWLIHDRGSNFSAFDKVIDGVGLKLLKTPPRAPKANAYCERAIGTMRRECLDHVIPLGERHLRLLLREWVEHYNHGRPHSSLGPGLPEPRDGLPIALQSHHHRLPAGPRVSRKPVLGGLHHEYRLEPAAATG